jgi:hypothetical protein
MPYLAAGQPSLEKAPRFSQERQNFLKIALTPLIFYSKSTAS